MCYDTIGMTRFACGHSKPEGPRTQRDCGSRQCRYSKNHPSPCSNCVTTCMQWMMPPRLLPTPGTAPGLCYNCLNPPRS